jgi:homoserine kinase
MRVTIRAPATCANLGPGFDCFGLALDLCNEVTIDTEAAPGVSWSGEGASELPTDGTDRVSRTMAAVAAATGRELPPFELRARNLIPLERGLGSSAAAAVSGVLAADTLLGLGLGADDVVSSAAGVEGHPDNAAAAVLGGLTVSTDGAVVRADPHPSLSPVVLVPEELRLATAAAREALAPLVPIEDAVFNLQHAALAVVALTERPDLLALALEDRLHQDARLELVPQVRAAFDRVRSAGVPVCVSGAGPALLAFEVGSASVPEIGDGWRVLRPGVRPRGAQVEVEGS